MVFYWYFEWQTSHYLNNLWASSMTHTHTMSWKRLTLYIRGDHKIWEALIFGWVTPLIWTTCLRWIRLICAIIICPSIGQVPSVMVLCWFSQDLKISDTRYSTLNMPAVLFFCHILIIITALCGFMWFIYPYSSGLIHWYTCPSTNNNYPAEYGKFNH